MGSLSREVKEKQVAAAKAKLDAFVTAQKEQGVDEKIMAKNTVYRKLAANVRKAKKRIAAIDAAIAHVARVKGIETKAAKKEKSAKKVAVPAQAPRKKTTAKKKK